MEVNVVDNDSNVNHASGAEPGKNGRSPIDPGVMLVSLAD